LVFLLILLILFYTITILPILSGDNTCPVTVREERRLRVFENRAMRRIFGAKRDEVTGGAEKTA